MAGVAWDVSSGSKAGVRVVHLRGHVYALDPLADSAILEERVMRAAEGDEEDVLLDLSEVWSIHPLLLARLANLASRLDASHRHVRWRGLRKGIARLLAEIAPGSLVSGEGSGSEQIGTNSD